MASLPSFVGDIHHLFGQLGHLAALESHKIFEFLAGHAVLVVVIALVDDKLGAEAVAHLLLELFKNIRAYRGRIRHTNPHTFSRFSSSNTSVNWWKKVV